MIGVLWLKMGQKNYRIAETRMTQKLVLLISHYMIHIHITWSTPKFQQIFLWIEKSYVKWLSPQVKNNNMLHASKVYHSIGNLILGYITYCNFFIKPLGANFLTSMIKGGLTEKGIIKRGVIFN